MTFSVCLHVLFLTFSVCLHVFYAFSRVFHGFLLTKTRSPCFSRLYLSGGRVTAAGNMTLVDCGDNGQCGETKDATELRLLSRSSTPCWGCVESAGMVEPSPAAQRPCVDSMGGGRGSVSNTLVPRQCASRHFQRHNNCFTHYVATKYCV